VISSRAWPWVVVGVVVLSLRCSVGARLLGRPQFVVSIGSPALVLTAWAFSGHLITLDDDFPGDWSNPERSAKFVYQSLLALAVKLIFFCLTCRAIFY
jgi:hypothetical protein